MTGKRVIITGATNGIGLAAARALAGGGARLSIVARSANRASAALEAIKSTAPAADVDVLMADLASQRSIRALAAEILARYPKVDVLINNAGAVYNTRQLSEDGIELTWAVNHLAPFLLTTLLVERLEASAPARVITTSSEAYRGAKGIPFDDVDGTRAYADGPWYGRGFTRYSQTKLANILFTQELARRIEGSGVTANCFHPGFVASGFNRNNSGMTTAMMTLIRPFARSPEKGADTLVWLASGLEGADHSGGYFSDRRLVRPRPEALDRMAAKRLWEVSEQQVRVSVP